MRGVVEKVTDSKTGKSWRAYIGGKWYGAKFDTRIKDALGKTIDFKAEMSDDPKYGEWLVSWAYDQTPTPTPPTQPQAANSPTGARLAEPELRFVSNLVASAITAGKITSPLEISVWAKAAAATVREL